MWLQRLLQRWATRGVAEASRAVGYPKHSAGFGEVGGGAWGAGAALPGGFEPADLEAVDAAVRELEASLLAAVLAAYRPWLRPALAGQGWPVRGSTHYARLKRAHEFLVLLIRPAME